MIQIGDKIISRELFEDHFICDLGACHGNCCVFGDSGAPLEEEEADHLMTSLKDIIRYMRKEGVQAVDKQGCYVIDEDGDKVTPLVGRDECAFVVFENRIARCAIEKAYEDGAVNFQKPVSCHLYPIRVSKLRSGMALNYHRWGICEPARELGKNKGVPVFRFLKNPIQRVFGEEFYNELELVYAELIKDQPVRKSN